MKTSDMNISVMHIKVKMSDCSDTNHEERNEFANIKNNGVY